MLVKDYVDYPHSSARYYETNAQGVFTVIHFKDV